MSGNPTVQAYDRYADVYDDEVTNFWNNFPTEFVDRYVNSLPGKRTLSLGSGSGRDAILLKDRGLEVVCVDASETMIEMTKKLGFESHLLQFSELNFPDNSFDGVWAYMSLIHITKDEAKTVLINLHKMLRPKGALVVGVIQGDSAKMVERSSMPGAVRYFRNYTSDELKDLVESAGFKFVYEQKYQPHNSVYLNHIYLKHD